jgi:hypothetical protein
VRWGIDRFTRAGVVFEGGQQATFDAVILATGYRPQVSDFLDVPEAFDANGMPVASGGEAPVPGLYFCGFHVSPGGMLQAIAREAPAIATAIAAG